MEQILHTRDIDEHLEAGAGQMVEFDTVAIPSGYGMFGFYQKQNESRWELIMTSITLEAFREQRD